VAVENAWSPGAATAGVVAGVTVSTAPSRTATGSRRIDLMAHLPRQGVKVNTGRVTSS
jgi:hypothetical protein